MVGDAAVDVHATVVDVGADELHERRVIGLSCENRIGHPSNESRRVERDVFANQPVGRLRGRAKLRQKKFCRRRHDVREALVERAGVVAVCEAQE